MMNATSGVRFGAVYKAETSYRPFDLETKSSSFGALYDAVHSVEKEREGRGIPTALLHAGDLDLPSNERPNFETAYLFTATDAAKAKPLIVKIKRLGELLRCFDRGLDSSNQYKEGAALTSFLRGKDATVYDFQPLSVSRSSQLEESLTSLVREEFVETSNELKDMVSKARVKTIDVDA